MGKKKTEVPFEEAMKQLEEVVQQLEAGDVPLEKAIALFQEGMALSKQCSEKLTDVEQKIEMLLEQEGEKIVVPFQLEGDNE
ncbi:exodeoxyribonuclease VII small subunit [Aneurinibacillus aneurinilyticus]|jgi:exodeoxyribonuclease VII small subunit|uniref:Exodeoxyribonuclease 7 small subunit n=2 Tax=Aneurinibacillus aneurinilyticus TaxID=1391 RepID=A0A848D540_ANEAE|nr:exodeoxyribonuclease VII small subunit [Aneurinibacillus aneurinilyticus]ERI08029.1 exodeoxyribonuclease VII, small subunit [Aneurinibacillus aneurinilyticus ATCC 12856]MCI1695881.1 exodeoxyribonuclease VII small subunit [Aneurinibacillus aneurinilyticus]MED0673493.1 exodeoxyribonuclease VII small subunit [Aneurinibacillus aneurinilyticus]MED0707268.1 exodeoxyribonuclease VII small subunit [Aneurinibacillus aneurinilyticus]MED0722257.1 exodeoxyribonuclease VII small subunit [Aneurinibacillu